MRRLICAFLSVLMLFSVLAVGTVHAEAASNMTTSEKAIELLKEMEGFDPIGYRDNGQYSIGYGSGCNPADYPNGITKEQADALLREYLVKMEADVNKFAARYNLTFTQNEFDALMLFTYNLGSGWTTSDSDFRTAVINGAKGNDFIFYITRWCTASEQVQVGLINRRMAEADLFLNGYYETTPPSNYGYVLFDVNGGNSCDVTVQGYDASEPVAVRAVPAYTGYRFLGWYTAKEGGKWVTNLDSSTKGLTLYAHWQKDEGNVGEGGVILGTAANYTRYVGDKGTKVYSAPSASAETVKTLEKGASVTVAADYVDASGVKWGKISDGWVILNDSTVSVTAAQKPDRPVEEEDAFEPVKVIVTSTYINVRRGPGTANDVISKVYSGDVLTITDTKTVGSDKWGKFSGGWVSLMYTNYDAVMENVNTNTGDIIATGIVKNCGGLRIRSEAGTASTVLGNLTGGTAVNITQIKDVNGQSWGRINSGWICLDYVTVTMLSTDTGKDDTTTEAPDDSDEEEGSAGDTAQTTGTVISNNGLNIRKGAGTGFAVVGSYPRGTKLVILEQITLNGDRWGRTDKGWVSMYYVRLDTTAEEEDKKEENTGSNTGSGSTDTTAPAAGVKGVVTCNSLFIRSGAGTKNPTQGYLVNGTEVVILETKLLGNTSWGRIDKGWICLSYVKLEVDNSTGGNTGDTEPDKQPETDTDQDTDSGNTGNTGNSVNTGTTNTVIATGKIVNANSLRIRSAASTNSTVVGGLTMGESVSIYEMKQSEGMVWGRIDKGWISMNYVKMDTSGSNQVVMTGVITTGLNIRSAAGTKNAIVGAYAMGAKVDIYETTTVNGESWGRTDKGWICLTFVK